MWFSQSEVVLHSNLLNLGEKDKEFSSEWFVNTDPCGAFSPLLLQCASYDWHCRKGD